MNILAIVYILYFLITVTVIHLFARSLAKASSTVLHEVFSGNGDLARLVGRLVIASFFLANVGFVVWNLPSTYGDALTTRRAVAMLISSLGSAMLFLGFTLFLGLWIFARMRRLGTSTVLGNSAQLSPERS